MNIQDLDRCIEDAKSELKKLRQYKRLLIKIQAEKDEINAIGSPTPIGEESTINGDYPPMEGDIPPINDGSSTLDSGSPTPIGEESTINGDMPTMEVGSPILNDDTPTMETTTAMPPVLYALPDPEDLSTLNLRQLRDRARGRVPGFMRLNKADLLQALAA